MKQIFNIIILTLTLALSACNEWLDINPALEIREEESFSTEQGFQDLLVGAYIRMASSSLYGLNTTVVLPEMITQHWTVRAGTSNELLTSLTGFDYTSSVSKSLLETTWLAYYKTISNLNSLLAHIDEKKALFTDGNYELIKGEAIGLRAFLHLEILRFWSPVTSQINLDDKAIPYVKTVTKDPNELLTRTYREVLDNIINELDQAEALLADDPILTYTNTQLNAPGTLQGSDLTINDFHYFRQVRFNYYAVKAAKARYYLFINNINGIGDTKSLAARYALEVIEAQNSDGSLKFTLGNESEAGYGRLTFPTEHVFAVNNSLATTTLKAAFFEYTTAFTQDKTKLATAYESALHPLDIRYRDQRLWENKTIPLVGDFNYFRKFNDTETTAEADMPLMRLSEMYFIAVECGRPDLFRTFRIARNMDSSIDDTLIDEDAIKERLEKEYRKEFYGEGQMYFFYKRLNYTKFTWPAALSFSWENLLLPLPDSQLLFEI
ncbi:MAG: RagB/SusD family nutrient uptake outer membrane protein [Dysgonamonadaceae bacterium]|nr:RagB/SusD family nutrient uptake outer membrane protein [Dysgonamonadaceae bacterium]